MDLPSLPEREEIFKIHLEKRNRLSSGFNLKEFAKQTEGFSGAEIEQLIISALYDAFDKDHDLSTEDIESNVKATTPLSKTKQEVIESLRNWAKGRAVFAS